MPVICNRWLTATALTLSLLSAGCQRGGAMPGVGAVGAPLIPVPFPTPVEPVVLEAVEVRRLAGRIDPVVPAQQVDAILHRQEGLDAAMEARIAHWINRWTGSGARSFQRDLERAARYGPWIEAELEARGLPASLRALPILESGYNPLATSPAGAGGLWQIMPPTARSLGLRVDALIDERRDPIRSTEAALDYLTGLYDQFGSWFLALAAYNAGSGRVRQVLQAAPGQGDLSGDVVYSQLRRRFPAVTQDFVPRFLAAARLMKDPEGFGLRMPEDVEPWRFDEVEVPGATALDAVARAAAVSTAELRTLNPQILRGQTPPGSAIRLRLPPGHREILERADVEIPLGERSPAVEHRVVAGETLSRIASRYGVSVSELERSNPGVDPRRLRIGQRLTIPAG